MYDILTKASMLTVLIIGIDKANKRVAIVYP